MAQSSCRFSGIFICYRRDDSAGHAGRLYDQFVTYFGAEQVFMDLDQIEPGEDFEQVIDEAVGSCETLIVLIGRDWLTSRDKKKRLDNPKDFVRLEIAAALERNIRVIPVLVQGAAMPRPEDLPVELSRFSRRQAFELSDRRWKQDAERLISALERTLEVRRINLRHITARGEAGYQRHEAKGTRVQAEGDGPRGEGVSPLTPDVKPVARRRVGGHRVAQAKAWLARGRRRPSMIVAGLALGVAGIAGAVFIIGWVIGNQDPSSELAGATQAAQLQVGSNSRPLQPGTPPTGQAERNPAPEPPATPKTQPNINLRAEVVPTPHEKTPSPTASPKATPRAAPAGVAKPAERYERGVKLWSSDRSAALVEFRAAAAGGNVDADYYLGRAVVEERRRSPLNRAQIVAALGHFQRAQRGRHAAQARDQARKLEKEFDRLRRQQ